MNVREFHNVPSLNAPVRLSDYVAGVFVSIPARMGMKKAIKKGLVTVDDKPGTTGLYIRGGEIIKLHEIANDDENSKINLQLEVLFEDEYLAVIVKPAGILVSGNKFKTIDKALPTALNKSSLEDALLRPHPAHRLDFATSGLLLIGKTSSALSALNLMFENKKINKIYHAVTSHKMSESGLIDKMIDTKHATTKFRVLKTLPSPKYDYLNLVKLWPATGRRHQLRIHLSSQGNPILGDKMYGIKGEIVQGNGLYLHATSLDFVHPFTNVRISLKLKLPKKITRIFGDLEFE